MKLKDKVKALVDLHARFMPLQVQFHRDQQALDEDLEKYVKGAWRKAFPGVQARIFASLGAGWMTDKWEREITIYNVDGHVSTARGWVKLEPPSYDVFTHSKFKKTPVGAKKLDAFMKTIAEETGIKCVIHDQTIQDSENVQLNSFEALKVVHGKGIKEVLSGRISYLGWEGTDRWCVFADAKGHYHVRYDSSAHGYGMTHHIEPGESHRLDAFATMGEGQSDDAVKLVRANWEKMAR